MTRLLLRIDDSQPDVNDTLCVRYIPAMTTGDKGRDVAIRQPLRPPLDKPDREVIFRTTGLLHPTDEPVSSARTGLLTILQ